MRDTSSTAKMIFPYAFLQFELKARAKITYAPLLTVKTYI